MPARDLRSALLAAASVLVDTEGPEALTLRALGSRAGVSRQAPYRHFADKHALLVTLACEGLRIERAWAEAGVASAGNPAEALLALCRAHIRLRREHPGMFRLAHGEIGKGDDPELQREAKASFSLLRTAVEAATRRDDDLARVRRRCMIVWGLARGMAELEAMASRPTSVPGDPDAWLRHGLDALLRAWASPPLDRDAGDRR